MTILFQNEKPQIMNSKLLCPLLFLIFISNILWSQTGFYPGDIPAYQTCSDCNGNIANSWSLNSTNVFNYNATANHTNNHISSDFGPRYIPEWDWHTALDYNPLGANADAGYAITSLESGTIDNITNGTGIKQIRIADWVYIHIFTNIAAPSVQKTIACPVTGTNTFYYDSFRMGNFCLTHTSNRKYCNCNYRECNKFRVALSE